MWRKRKPSEFEKKYSLHLIIGVYVFLILSVFIGRITFSSKKSNYTEITGVITHKYIKSRYSSRHSRKYNSYLTVQYSANGKEETIDGMPANFGESEGNIIHFYLTKDGIAVREPVFSSFYPFYVFNDMLNCGEKNMG